MTSIAVEARFDKEFPIRVNDLEIHEEAALGSLDAYHRLVEKYPDYHITMVWGSDLLQVIVLDLGQRPPSGNSLR